MINRARIRRRIARTNPGPFLFGIRLRFANLNPAPESTLTLEKILRAKRILERAEPLP